MTKSKSLLILSFLCIMLFLFMHIRGTVSASKPTIAYVDGIHGLFTIDICTENYYNELKIETFSFPKDAIIEITIRKPNGSIVYSPKDGILIGNQKIENIKFENMPNGIYTVEYSIDKDVDGSISITLFKIN